MNKALEINSLTHNYKKLTVINNISFTVNTGEYFIIIGPNGSGKTTIVKILAGIIKNSAGDVKINNTNIKAFSAKDLARNIAFVPQELPSDFPLRVQEIVLMGRYPHVGLLGIEKADDIKIANEAMKFTSIDNLSSRKLNQLSGGERQRVFIAKAICQQPKIIILDEPTASLDLSHQINIMELLKKLKKEQGMTIIMVSHDLNLAAMYAEKILLLEKGEIAKIGEPSEVLTQSILENVYRCKLLVTKSFKGEFPIIYSIYPIDVINEQTLV